MYVFSQKIKLQNNHYYVKVTVCVCMRELTTFSILITLI